jgi:hypothetical protein
MAMLRISSCALLCLALLSGACAAQTPLFDAWFAA